jgi:hypothetical protein
VGTAVGSTGVAVGTVGVSVESAVIGVGTITPPVSCVGIWGNSVESGRQAASNKINSVYKSEIRLMIISPENNYFVQPIRARSEYGRPLAKGYD